MLHYSFSGLVFSSSNEELSVHREGDPLLITKQADHKNATLYNFAGHNRRFMKLFADTVIFALVCGCASGIEA